MWDYPQLRNTDHSKGDKDWNRCETDLGKFWNCQKKLLQMISKLPQIRLWGLGNYKKNKPYAVEQHSLKTKRSYGRDRFGTHQIICKETSRQNYRWARYFHFWIQFSCILKQRDLMPTPNHFLLSAANELKDKTEFAHHMWQTDFTYLKIMGWWWY